MMFSIITTRLTGGYDCFSLGAYIGEERRVCEQCIPDVALVLTS